MRFFVETNDVVYKCDFFFSFVCFVWGEDKRHVDAFIAVVEQTGLSRGTWSNRVWIGQYFVTF